MASLIQTEMEANALLREHGLWDKGWRFQWDNARRRGGAAHFTTKRITMSRHLVPLWEPAEVTQTLVHEVAHALVGHEVGHGPAWRAKMRELGARPDATHSNPTVQGRYLARCPGCQKDVYRAHRWTKAMAQGRHYHKPCGRPLLWFDTQGTKV
ncbi:SprT-like protease [Microbacterium phage Cece]|nr:SprT-like protease [Microbacterium phage Cece]UVG35327.1 SprT-like protease [Microbacterium phage Cece]